jgi:hypothetical protein
VGGLAGFREGPEDEPVCSVDRFGGMAKDAFACCTSSERLSLASVCSGVYATVDTTS